VLPFEFGTAVACHQSPRELAAHSTSTKTMSESRYAGLAAIVTGGASGIGRAIAARLAREGATVLVADIDGAKAGAAADELGADGVGRVLLAQGCDVGDESQVIRCCDALMSRCGRIDVVVNNAGLMTFKGLDEWTVDDWTGVLRVDLLGAALFTKHAFRLMRAGGAIVNVASVHALMTTANVAPYAAAKAGLLSLTRSSAIEGKARSIRANAVLPGAIDTPMLWSNPNVRSGLERIDRADVGMADDVASAVAYLASAEARFITGAALAVDGGRLATL
jgi:NAD(P)-dependent dehydrogenase (short-subunit alcohol dehydrogenase family)